MNENNMNEQVQGFNDRRAMLAGIGGIAAGAILAGRTQAGPLDPPPGPIASTGKPLAELEPRIAINSSNTPGDADSTFHITQPGSYYLASNVFGLLGKHGIKVSASGVTIDLNGMVLRGLGTLMGNFDGVHASQSTERIVVRNGHIEVMGRYGINLGSSSYSTIEQMTVRLCIESGISAGTDSRVLSCTSSDNNGSGISVGIRSVVQGCITTSNQNDGVVSVKNAIIDRCTCNNNASSGISTSTGSTVTECLSNGNTDFGIIAFGGIVSRCIASENGSDGIYVSNDCLVRECRSAENDGHGIRAASNCYVVGNNCNSNGSLGEGAGIDVTGGDSRIEGNNCTDNELGINVNSPGNLIIRNTCAGNTTNWSVTSGNTILVISGSTAGVVNGNSGGISPGSTDPNANYTF